MTKEEDINIEIQKKIEQAKKEMMEKGRNYDGLGEELDKLGHEGPYFGPSNDIEGRKLIKEIRESGKGDSSATQIKAPQDNPPLLKNSSYKNVRLISVQDGYF